MNDLKFFDLMASLDDEHKQNLAWFWENKSKVMISIEKTYKKHKN